MGLHSTEKSPQQTFRISSDALVQFAVVFAALIHDVDHYLKITNSQRINEGCNLVVRYNHRCVSRQNSLDIAWSLRMEEQCRELRQCVCSCEQEPHRFRKLLVNAVIAADLTDDNLQ